MGTCAGDAWGHLLVIRGVCVWSRPRVGRMLGAGQDEAIEPQPARAHIRRVHFDPGSQFTQAPGDMSHFHASDRHRREPEMSMIQRFRSMVLGIVAVLTFALVAPIAVHAEDQVLVGEQVLPVEEQVPALAPAASSWGETSGYNAVEAARALTAQHALRTGDIGSMQEERLSAIVAAAPAWDGQVGTAPWRPVVRPRPALSPRQLVGLTPPSPTRTSFLRSSAPLNGPSAAILERSNWRSHPAPSLTRHTVLAPLNWQLVAARCLRAARRESAPA
jgi:hypothetical protein